MKTVICETFGGGAGCTFAVQAETPESAMQALMPHWKEQHQNLMEGKTEQDRVLWMQAFHTSWKQTPNS